MRATCTVNLILFHLIFVIILGEDHRLLSSSFAKFFSLLLVHPFFVQNIILSTTTTSLNVADQVSHPYMHLGGKSLMRNRKSNV
jgi:hypothetical protein